MTALTVEVGGLPTGTGTSYRILTMSNLWRQPDLRPSGLDRPQAHGQFAGADLLGVRRLSVTYQIEADTMGAALALLDALTAAWRPSSTGIEALDVVDDNGAFRYIGSPRLADPDMRNAAVGVIEVEARFAARDPRRYAAVEADDSVAFPAGGTGFTFPLTFPLVFGSAGVTGIVDADNDGTIPTPWQATITGPWTNPTILHVGSGRQLTINVDLLAGQTLEIDSAAQSILLNGTASRFSSLLQPADWFDLDVGANEVRFGGASGSGTAELRWRSAWQ